MMPQLHLTNNPGFPNDLFDEPDKFLANYNFHRLLIPSDGDILTYVSAGERYLQAKHLGIFNAGKVISKFSAGHIFRHDIEQVPLSYGEKVIFYGRNQINE